MDEVTRDVSADPAAGVAEFDSQVAEQLRVEIAQRRVRVEQLQAELSALMPFIRRYEKALALLVGEPATPAAKPAKSSSNGKHSNAKGVSEGTVAQVRNTILTLAANQDEFTQTQVRAVTGLSSGVSSLAFEQLRQAGVVRLARQDGNQKIYRLTREAAREVES